MQNLNKVTVSAPAHLHTGNFDVTGDLGRFFGTVGFAIDRQLKIEVAKADGVKAEDASANLFANRFVDTFQLAGAEVKVTQRIPEFVGVGYHTTLALSIGTALARLYNLDLTTEQIALTMKRGAVTSLGVHAFKVGGFIVEGGYRIDQREKMIPPIVFQRPVPDNWLFVVAIPQAPIQKIVEMRTDEDNILRNLKLLPKENSDELARIVLVKIMPAIIEEDLQAFGEGLTAFNSKLGKFWNEFQCGRTYCHPVVEEGIKLVLRRSSCACQTSWGPTFYGIVDGKNQAETLVKELRAFLDENGGGEVFYTKAANSGATLKEL
ncbi:MAG: GHMP kinase [Candidatus Bathyarchaeota archaeon]|nr:GHMP kinase [Candidatus Bathyarchaeota archaeon]